ncbi:integrase core domain-containing protein [Coraliomargarita algicola]|uniref:Integrase core domain-containing protein n=1 Tax=Coraliomargarita algicola TaxID=3092156 RepID=A0ABZ0RM45_9BACT|nr:integrase core domain-containing protein [Coraliomargarita sp. J2-16]WPJ97289.1 integrase core domain-containing protein [Coraliomargarita sp. J2-16]
MDKTWLSALSCIFVMSLAKRKVEIAHIGCQVNGEVMAQVARNLSDVEDGFLRDMKYFICDRDVLFTKEYRSILEGSGVEVIRTRVGRPQQNGYAERFVKPIKTGCLDHYIFLGEKLLLRAVEQYVKHISLPMALSPNQVTIQILYITIF